MRCLLTEPAVLLTSIRRATAAGTMIQENIELALPVGALVVYTVEGTACGGYMGTLVGGKPTRIDAVEPDVIYAEEGLPPKGVAERAPLYGVKVTTTDGPMDEPVTRYMGPWAAVLSLLADHGPELILPGKGGV